MLVMFIVCLSFILGVVFSKDINSFLKKCFEKIVRFRESTRDEEIKNLENDLLKIGRMNEKNESIIKEKDDQILILIEKLNRRRNYEF